MISHRNSPWQLASSTNVTVSLIQTTALLCTLYFISISIFPPGLDHAPGPFVALGFCLLADQSTPHCPWTLEQNERGAVYLHCCLVTLYSILYTPLMCLYRVGWNTFPGHHHAIRCLLLDRSSLGKWRDWCDQWLEGRERMQSVGQWRHSFPLKDSGERME